MNYTISDLEEVYNILRTKNSLIDQLRTKNRELKEKLNIIDEPVDQTIINRSYWLSCEKGHDCPHSYHINDPNSKLHYKYLGDSCMKCPLKLVKIREITLRTGNSMESKSVITCESKCKCDKKHKL